jgi:TRAP-type mannitol/chloroaromatic compound transport system permease small subunit
MRQSNRYLIGVLKIIDSASEWSGRMSAWLIIILMGALTYEVVARYLFRAPTIWAYDMTYMLYGTLFMMGAAYTLREGAHVRTDLLYRKLSERQQGILDAVLYTAFFLPALVFFIMASADIAGESWTRRERSLLSIWRPPIYPFKAVVPVAMSLLLIQAVAETLRSLHAAVRGYRP